MASLTGNSIASSYVGLIKTDGNTALGAGQINLTDGLGNLTGMSINNTAKELKYTQSGSVTHAIQNSNWDITQYPMSAISGEWVAVNFKDANGLDTGYILQDRYGSIEYQNINGEPGKGETHYFTSKTAAGAVTPAKIAMDTWNGPNNSTNWNLGYIRSVTAASYNAGTQNLTLSRQGTTSLVVNIPTGGGVTSLNTLAGALNIAAGSNVTVTDNGTDTITIAATGGGGGGMYNPNYIPFKGNMNGYGNTYWQLSQPMTGDASWFEGSDINSQTNVFGKLIVKDGMPISTIGFINGNGGVSSNTDLQFSIWTSHEPTEISAEWYSGTPKDKVYSESFVVTSADPAGGVISFNLTTPFSVDPSKVYWFSFTSDDFPAWNFKNFIGRQHVSNNFLTVYDTNNPGANGYINTLYFTGVTGASLPADEAFGHRDEALILLYK